MVTTTSRSNGVNHNSLAYRHLFAKPRFNEEIAVRMHLLDMWLWIIAAVAAYFD